MKVHGEDILTLPSSSPSLALVLCSPQFYFPYSDGGLPGCTLPLSKWTPRCVHHTQRQPICLGVPVGHSDVPTRPSQSWHCPGHVISGSLTPIWPEPHPQGCPRPPCLSRSWRPRDLCPTPTSLLPLLGHVGSLLWPSGWGKRAQIRRSGETPCRGNWEVLGGGLPSAASQCPL